jgi:hypothetical protein
MYSPPRPNLSEQFAGVKITSTYSQLTSAFTQRWGISSAAAGSVAQLVIRGNIDDVVTNVAAVAKG